MKRTPLIAVLSMLLASAGRADPAPPAKASDCDMRAPAFAAIGKNASLQNRLRPGGWAWWKAGGGGGFIVCVFKNKYLKGSGALRSVAEDEDDLLIDDDAGRTVHVVKSRLSGAGAFSEERDLSGFAWLTKGGTPEHPELTVLPRAYGDSPEQRQAAIARALALFAQSGGAQGDPKAARKRRACLESFLKARANTGAVLFPAGSPTDKTDWADSVAPESAVPDHVLEIDGALYIKLGGSGELAPCL